MLLALQLIKMPFSQPENGIFCFENAVHLTSMCIMRFLSALDANDDAEVRQGGGEGQGEVKKVHHLWCGLKSEISEFSP